MSVASEKTRIENARNRIRNHLVSLGIADNTEKLPSLAEKVEMLSLGGGIDIDGHCVVYLRDNKLKKYNLTNINAISGFSYPKIDGDTLYTDGIIAVFTSDMTDVTAIPNQFLYNYSNLVSLTLPPNITSVGDNFMYGCHSFNKRLILPNSVKTIGRGFLSNSMSFSNGLYPFDFPSQLTSISDDFFASSVLYNSNITLPSGLTSIGDRFLFSCYLYNSTTTISNTVKNIGNYFMSECLMYNKNLTIPSTVTNIGTNFMSNCKNYVSTITANCNSSVAVSSNYTLGTTDVNAPCYTKGITMAGTYASAWKSAFANRTSSPYRKLL